MTQSALLDNKTSLFGMDLGQLEDFVLANGLEKFRAKQNRNCKYKN